MQKVFVPLVGGIWSLETLMSNFLVVREAITPIVFGQFWLDSVPEMSLFPSSVKSRQLGETLCGLLTDLFNSCASFIATISSRSSSTSFSSWRRSAKTRRPWGVVGKLACALIAANYCLAFRSLC